jgi:oxaloacetate decarboxylase gamma subunit
MEQLSSGLTLMAIGMTIVILFLSLLIILTNMMSSIVKRFFPEPVSTGGAGASGQAGIGGGEIAAITAAVHQHMRSKK